jgi:hypothetical protein
MFDLCSWTGYTLMWSDDDDDDDDDNNKQWHIKKQLYQ